MAKNTTNYGAFSTNYNRKFLKTTATLIQMTAKNYYIVDQKCTTIHDGSNFPKSLISVISAAFTVTEILK